MDARLLDELEEVFTDLLHGYKEVVTNTYTEELESVGDRIIDPRAMVEFIEVKSVETEFTERFRERIADILEIADEQG